MSMGRLLLCLCVEEGIRTGLWFIFFSLIRSFVHPSIHLSAQAHSHSLSSNCVRPGHSDKSPSSSGHRNTAFQKVQCVFSNSIIDSLGQRSLGRGGCPEHCRMFCGIPGLYSLDASSIPPSCENPKCLGIGKCPLGCKIAPG